MDAIIGYPPAASRRPLPSDIESKVRTAFAEPHRVLFLDVETTGLSRYYDHITLIGWNLDSEYQVSLASETSDGLAKACAQASTLVTFNGTLFDIPFLRKTFPDLTIPPAHIDLRYLARRVGLVGGQKKIEQELGIGLRDGFADVDGRIAVLLWHQYLRGDDAALKRLIEYNRADVLSMRHIFDHVVDRLPLQPDLFSRTRPKFASQVVKAKGHARRSAQVPARPEEHSRTYTFESLFADTSVRSARVVGIDLTGSARRPSGWCLLQGCEASTTLLNEDEEIVAATLAANPNVVSIDSPLSIPFGRNHVRDDDPARQQYGIMRQCERELKRRGINVYPCLLPSMQKLTERGIRLASEFRKRGIPTIECYPGAAQDIIRIPRKGAGLDLLTRGLLEFGLQGPYSTATISHDELDAITCSLVGHFFLAGQYEALTGPDEGDLIIPLVGAKQPSIVLGISGRIAAGKTTLAKMLEERGFAYTRFSMVIDDLLQARGEKQTREARQREGLRVHSEHGQRWLAERVVKRVEGERCIVVDGLRFLEDHSYLAERYGSNFLHIHVSTSAETRQRRYVEAGATADEFKSADAQTVEASIDQLALVAHSTVRNDGSLADLETALNVAAGTLLKTIQCQSQ